MKPSAMWNLGQLYWHQRRPGHLDLLTRHEYLLQLKLSRSITPASLVTTDP